MGATQRPAGYILITTLKKLFGYGRVRVRVRDRWGHTPSGWLYSDIHDH